MSRLRDRLKRVAVVSTLVATTPALAEEALPDIDTVTKDAATIIQQTNNPRKLRTIQRDLERLLRNAIQKKQLHEIEAILPDVNEDLESWSHSYDEDKSDYPKSENIGKLQKLLGMKGDDIDKKFGKNTAQELLYTAQRALGNVHNNTLPTLDIESYKGVAAQIRTVASDDYSSYLESVLHTESENGQTMTDELKTATNKISELTEFTFEKCTGDKLEHDREGFVRRLVKALDNPQTNTSFVIDNICEGLAEHLSPEQQEKLLDNLTAELEKPIDQARSILETEKQIKNLEELLKKYQPNEQPRNHGTIPNSRNSSSGQFKI